MTAYPYLDTVYFDSGILIGAIIAGSAHSEAASDFCEQVAINGSRVVFSQIARYELAHLAWCFANPRNRRTLPDDIVDQYALEHWGSNLLVRQRWFDVLSRDLDALLSSFTEVFEIPIRARHWECAINYMSYYDLNSYDSLHLATAHLLEIRDFATCDRHFEHIDVVDAHIVRDGT